MTNRKWKELLAKEFKLSPICADILYRELLISVQKVKALDDIYKPKTTISEIIIDEFVGADMRGDK